MHFCLNNILTWNLIVICKNKRDMCISHTYVYLTYVYIYTHTHIYWSFPDSLVVKNPPSMQETWIWSLGREDLLEKEMATHSSILPWKIPWTKEPGRLQFMGLQTVRHDWTHTHTQVTKLVDFEPPYINFASIRSSLLIHQIHPFIHSTSPV